MTMPAFRLDNQVLLVTGAGNGIGNGSSGTRGSAKTSKEIPLPTDIPRHVRRSSHEAR